MSPSYWFRIELELHWVISHYFMWHHGCSLLQICLIQSWISLSCISNFGIFKQFSSNLVRVLYEDMWYYDEEVSPWIDEYIYKCKHLLRILHHLMYKDVLRHEFTFTMFTGVKYHIRLSVLHCQDIVTQTCLSLFIFSCHWPSGWYIICLWCSKSQI